MKLLDPTMAANGRNGRSVVRADVVAVEQVCLGVQEPLFVQADLDLVVRRKAISSSTSRNVAS